MFLSRCLLVLLITLSGAAVAGPLGSLGRATDSVRPPDQLLDRRGVKQKSAADAAREARRRHGGGKVLDVDSVAGGYRVKLIKNGDVRIVFVPN